MVCRLYVIGMGMGNPATLTLEAREALAASELVIGSPRLLEAVASDGLVRPQVRTVALVAGARIADELRRAPEGVACVVMSGDVGFYSGATSLYPHLAGEEWEAMDLRVIPGISSLAYLCARLRTPWQDVHVVSAHGRACDVAGAVQSHARTCVLAGGDTRPGELCARLVERGLGEVQVSVGERLSYPDERIVSGQARELAGRDFDGLAVMLVRNDAPIADGPRAPHLRDEDFERGGVPMTKEEVRELAVCKLRVQATDVVWDVGAGTGSVSVELARAAREGQVVAVERAPEAAELVERNRQRFGLPNLQVVVGEAPEVLRGLPAPDAVFVGGSGGHLAEVLAAALEANPTVRLCISAITLETLSAALAAARELGLRDVDIVQVSVAKAQVAGDYHLMRAQNPVWLVCAAGPETGAEADATDGRRPCE